MTECTTCSTCPAAAELDRMGLHVGRYDHVVALAGECECGEQPEAAVGSGDEDASHVSDPATPPVLCPSLADLCDRAE